MAEPTPGKIAWKVFQGEPEAVVAEANAFIDAHDNLKFPIQQAQTHWNADATKLSILLTITAPPGAGRPQLVRAERLIDQRANGA